MDVLFNETEDMVRASARAFLEGDCPPRLVREIEESGAGYSRDLWRRAAELGWLGTPFAERFGGQASPLTYVGIIAAEIGRAAAPLPFIATMAPALAIADAGSDALREAVLPRVCSGESVLTWALTERDPRVRAESVQLEAVRDGDHYRLTGSKLFVEHFRGAQSCLVVARLPGSSGEAGIVLLLVDTASPGIEVVAMPNIAGEDLCEVRFSGVRVPASRCVGVPGQGWPVAQRMVERATALLCLQMTGAARKASELAVEYAKFRKAFGRPIGAFQSLAHMATDFPIWLDGCELLTYEALWRLDRGLPASVEVSQAKAFCSEKCMATVRNANVIHGGIAATWELNLQLWFRRVCAWAPRLGSAYEHRARVADAILPA
jgi:alkylation response protein AidB-like acyl-CoA dehydrogenase